MNDHNDNVDYRGTVYGRVASLNPTSTPPSYCVLWQDTSPAFLFILVLLLPVYSSTASVCRMFSFETKMCSKWKKCLFLTSWVLHHYHFLSLNSDQMFANYPSRKELGIWCRNIPISQIHQDWSNTVWLRRQWCVQTSEATICRSFVLYAYLFDLDIDIDLFCHFLYTTVDKKKFCLKQL